MTPRYRIGALLAALSLALPTFAQPQDIVTYPAGQPIVIGVSGLLVETELDPQTDEDILNALMLANELNPTLTIDGVEFAITFISEDDGCTEDGGQATANAFVAAEPPIVAAIGPTCSSACRTFATVFDVANYTSISPSCTATALAPEFASFNRTIANDDAQGVEAAIFVLDTLGISQIAIVHDDTDYGRALSEVFAVSVTELGADLVVQQEIERGTTDFTDLMADIEAGGAELVYYAGLAFEAAGVVSALRAAGLDDVAFMTGDGGYGDDFLSLAGEAAEGAYATLPTAPENEALTAFDAAFEERFERPIETVYHAYALDALTILRESIALVGQVNPDGSLTIDRISLRDAISSFSQAEASEGYSGLLQCNGDGECALSGIGFYQVTDGAFERIESGIMIMDF
jgi:branched-chain amino acid transport system substrate-binding protein